MSNWAGIIGGFLSLLFLIALCGLIWRIRNPVLPSVNTPPNNLALLGSEDQIHGDASLLGRKL